MIVIYINGEGTAQKVSPSHIYQGSNQTQVTVFAPIPTTSALSIAFKLPDGTRTTYYPMTPIQNSDGLLQYEFTLNSSITQKSGQASIALMAVFSDGRQTSQLIDIEIEPSVLPELPSDIDENAYEIIMRYLQQDRSDITALQGQMNDIEETAENAEKSATNAVETANEAKATADGLAASIAQANATAARAESIADGAVQDIAAYKEQIDKEVEDVTNTANGLAGSIAEANATAGRAVETANGATATAVEAKGIAEEALEQAKATGTKVNVGGEFAQELDFNSDPQRQIDGKVSKNGDTVNGKLIMAGGAEIYNEDQSTYIELGKAGKTGLEFHAQEDSNVYVDYDATIQAYDAQSKTGSGSAALRYIAREHNFSGGEINNVHGQQARGVKSVTTDNNLTGEASGFFDGAFTRYSKYIVCGDGGDKYLNGFDYQDGFLHIKVYNSGAAYRDGIIPYIEPSKLNPNTDNGWTMGGRYLKLPSYGLYLIYIDGEMGIFFHTNTYDGSFPLQSMIPFKVARYGYSAGWSSSPLADLSIVVPAATVGYKKLA